MWQILGWVWISLDVVLLDQSWNTFLCHLHIAPVLPFVCCCYMTLSGHYCVNFQFDIQKGCSVQGGFAAQDIKDVCEQGQYGEWQKSFHCGEKQCEIFVACWLLFAMIAHDKSNHDECEYFWAKWAYYIGVLKGGLLNFS